MSRSPAPSPTLAFVALVASLTLLLTSGCATFGRGEDIQTERLLASAGFQMRLADTDEKLAALKIQPQRKVVPQQENGRTYYLYADDDLCKCLYVGTERAYDRYERLALVHQLSIRRLEAADDRRAAAMDLAAWGPWAPWWR
jgi:hypothetical protein